MVLEGVDDAERLGIELRVKPYVDATDNYTISLTMTPIIKTFVDWADYSYELSVESNGQSVPYENILSEKELHRLDGFSKRRHRPDLVFTDKSQKKICAEVELSLKARDRFLKNIKDNFVGYDLQIWVVPSLRHKIAAILQEEQAAYNDIEILELKEVLSHGGNHQSTAPG